MICMYIVQQKSENIFLLIQYLITFNNKIKNKQMQAQIDYRNAKYQGEINGEEHRNGFGILVDDDLSFYASTWRDGKLNDSTMIYISHGKYIYGEWVDNQPYGLNVFRIGDTVVLGQFDNGSLIKKVLIIFQKLGFLAILEENHGEWSVCQRGILKNYNDLTRYIEEAGLPMQPQYFSLAKYINSMCNENVSIMQCQGTQNCYFGYKQGLGITFHSNNGVISIGYHSNKKLIQFGGKYELPHYVLQGNFSTNEIIRYTVERPKTQIYSIYQKLHKRSLNFKNEYFDSKIKLLSGIEELIRSKINQIVKQYNPDTNTNENTFTAVDLNDSLDYHVEISSVSDRNKINYKNDNYQPRHTNINDKISDAVQPQKQRQLNNVHGGNKKNEKYQKNQKNEKYQKNQKYQKYQKNERSSRLTNSNNMPTSPVLMKKSPFKNNDRIDKCYKNSEVIRTPSRKHIQTSNQPQTYDEITQHTFANPETKSPKISQQQKQHQKQHQKQYQKQYQKQHQKQYQKQYQKQHRQLQMTKSIRTPITKTPPQTKTEQQPQQKINYKNYQHKEKQQSPINKMMHSSKNYQKQQIQIQNPLPIPKYPFEQYQKDMQIQERIREKLRLSIYYDQNNKNEQSQHHQFQKQHPTTKIEPLELCDKMYDKNFGQMKMRKSNISCNKVQQHCRTPVKGPTYENLSQRRKRLLKQFKNVKAEIETTPSTINSIIQSQSTSKPTLPKLSFICSTPERNQKGLNGRTTNHQIPPTEMNEQEEEITYKRQKYRYCDSKNIEMQELLLPLAICKTNNQVSSYKRPMYCCKNQNKSSENRQNRQLRGTFMERQTATVSNRDTEPTIHKTYKQNMETVVSGYGLPLYDRKQVYQQKVMKAEFVPKLQKMDNLETTKSQLDLLTPTKKKIYKYYFEQ